MTWQLQDAKQRFSRLVDTARTDGPQVVTRHGREVAVVLSIEDYRRLRGGDGHTDSLLEGPADDAFADLLDEIVAAREVPEGTEFPE
ncbi:MAG: type II toxin-antitoxin system Phd/YefM family antitoxin [Thermoleophilia bacterium]|nr:type II toxin-antitoxin system Phd/YefM family antitoxin [Thermoleophilia bacterium]